jgi:hypothetical protein
MDGELYTAEENAGPGVSNDSDAKLRSVTKAMLAITLSVMMDSAMAVVMYLQDPLWHFNVRIGIMTCFSLSLIVAVIFVRKRRYEIGMRIAISWVWIGAITHVALFQVFGHAALLLVVTVSSGLAFFVFSAQNAG